MQKVSSDLGEDRFGSLQDVRQAAGRESVLAKLEETNRNVSRTAELPVPTVSVYEVFKRVLQQRGEGNAWQAVAVMRQGRLSELSEALALAAARISAENGLPMADSIILASVNACDATLWTQDADFEPVSGVRYQPTRRGRTTD